jgi:sporulation protein YlmC with PRC-barrel domain
MRLGKDIVNKPIISIDDGRFLGNVKDLYLDQDLQLVAGLFLGREGLLKRRDRLIGRKDVVVFGVDAVLVRHGAVVEEGRAAKDHAAWLRLDDLRGRDVTTPGGTRVGQIGDVILDEKAGVTAFSLSRIYVEGPIAENRGVARHAVLEIGAENAPLVVDLNLAESTRPEDPPPPTAADKTDKE